MTESDEAAICALIEAEFASLNWSSDRDPDWATFLGAFTDGATLIPAARPASPQSADSFVARMERLRDEGRLATFAEISKGIVVYGVGTVAVALAGCEMVENEHDVTRDVSVFLLVKDGAEWRIAAQAWDIVAGFDELEALARPSG